MTELVLVSCSKTKLEGTHLARDLYDPSPIFRKRVRLAEHREAHWGILSAKYGYLRPWEATPYYQTKINERGEVWAAFVLRDLLRDLAFYDAEVITILGGSKYADPLITPLEARGYDVIDFNRGKRPGERMAALDEAVAPGEQATIADGGFRVGEEVRTDGD